MNLYGFAGGDPTNFSDPFGLCPEPNDGDCPVFFVGLGINLVPGVGGGASVGVVLDQSQGLGGLGVFATGSVEGGVDLATFFEVGRSSGRADFIGSDVETCAGGGFVNGCVAESADGRTMSIQIGFPNRFIPDSKLSLTSGVSSTRGATGRDAFDAGAALVAEFTGRIRAFLLQNAGGSRR